MAKEVVTFRTETEKRAALDSMAKALGRDRSYVLNKAMDTLFDIYQWQVEHIQEGIRQADAGEFADESEWRKAISRNRK